MRLPADKRAKVVQVWCSGVQNMRAVARQCKVSPDFVRRWVHRFLETGAAQDAPRSGRPRKLASQQLQARLKHLTRQPECDTAGKIAKAFAVDEVDVHATTVARVLKRIGYKYSPAKWVRRVSPVCMAKRLKFARKYRNGAPWRATMYTDSSYFVLGKLGSARHRRWVLVDEDDAHLHMYSLHGLKVHVYGGICAHGKTKLVFVTGTTGKARPQGYKGRGVGADEYQTILREHLLPDARNIFLAHRIHDWWFMQDGATAHRAATTMQFLRVEVPHLWEDWPSNSADLNPIEQVWATMKRHLAGRSFDDIEEFKGAVQHAWDSCSQRVIKALINSMWRRLRAVERAKGGATKY